MPSYPGAIPSFPTLTDGVDYPQASHLNIPNREIEAICTVLGVNPKTITTTWNTAFPRATPQNVAHYVKMFAYIVKTLTGAANWYNANVPLRGFIAGNGGGNTVPASSTRYIVVSGAPQATEANAQLPFPTDGVISNFRFVILTAQPATGSLVFTIRKNGVDTLGTFTLAAGTGADTVGGADCSIAFSLDDKLSVKIVNNATGASAQIGAFSLEVDQVG